MPPKKSKSVEEGSASGSAAEAPKAKGKSKSKSAKKGKKSDEKEKDTVVVIEDPSGEFAVRISYHVDDDNNLERFGYRGLIAQYDADHHKMTDSSGKTIYEDYIFPLVSTVWTKSDGKKSDPNWYTGGRVPSVTPTMMLNFTTYIPNFPGEGGAKQKAEFAGMVESDYKRILRASVHYHTLVDKFVKEKEFILPDSSADIHDPYYTEDLKLDEADRARIASLPEIEREIESKRIKGISIDIEADKKDEDKQVGEAMLQQPVLTEVSFTDLQDKEYILTGRSRLALWRGNSADKSYDGPEDGWAGLDGKPVACATSFKFRGWLATQGKPGIKMHCCALSMAFQEIPAGSSDDRSEIAKKDREKLARLNAKINSSKGSALDKLTKAGPIRSIPSATGAGPASSTTTASGGPAPATGAGVTTSPGAGATSTTERNDESEKHPMDDGTAIYGDGQD